MGGMLARMALVLLVLAACTSGGEGTPAADAPPQGALVTFDAGSPDERVVSVEIADTTDERAQGLMGRTELRANSGMLFVFPEPSDGSFWMKDTLIPLSIAYWGADGVIHTISEMTPCEEDPCEVYPASAPYTHALEMDAGWFAEHGIEVGDRVDVDAIRS